MNDAQIGKNRLGAEFARIVIELSNHPFIVATIKSFLFYFINEQY